MKWPEKKIGDLTEVLSGFAFDSQFFNNEMGFKLIRIRDVVRSFSETFYNGKFEDRYVVKEGDFLIGMDGEFNIAKWGKEPALLNQRVCKITVKNNLLDEKYLFHFLPKQLKLIEDITPFVTVKHLSVKKLNEIKIPLPPLAEQQRIAELLDTADRILKQRESAIAKLDQLAQSVFFDMFGDVVQNEKKWLLKSLVDVTTKIGSGATPRGGDAEYKLDGISLIRSLNVHDGNFRTKNLAFIDDAQAAKLSNVVVEENDVLLNITGASVARVCRAPVSVLPARVNQHVMIVRPNASLNATFLERLLLTSAMKNKLLAVGSTGATREAITKANAENLQIPLPPIKLQNEFCSKFENIEKLKSSMKTCIEKTLHTTKSIQHQSFAMN